LQPALEEAHEVNTDAAAIASTRIKIDFLILRYFKLNINCLGTENWYQIIQRKGCGIVNDSNERMRNN
jgi:hypothetical protein